MSEIKPCPFCGTVPKVDTCTTSIYCPNCYARAPIAKIIPTDQRLGKKAREIAVMAWNTRAGDDRIDL